MKHVFLCYIIYTLFTIIHTTLVYLESVISTFRFVDEGICGMVKVFTLVQPRFVDTGKEMNISLVFPLHCKNVVCLLVDITFLQSKREFGHKLAIRLYCCTGPSHSLMQKVEQCRTGVPVVNKKCMSLTKVRLKHGTNKAS